jgi:anti-anti-sigma factor
MGSQTWSALDRVWGIEPLTTTVVKCDELRASLRAVGDLDLCGARTLDAVVGEQIACGRRFLRLDLSEVSFLDSAGMRALHSMHQDLLARRGTLIISGATERARRLLAVVGLDRELFLVDSYVDAELAVVP